MLVGGRATFLHHTSPVGVGDLGVIAGVAEDVQRADIAALGDVPGRVLRADRVVRVHVQIGEVRALGWQLSEAVKVTGSRELRTGGQLRAQLLRRRTDRDGRHLQRAGGPAAIGKAHSGEQVTAAGRLYRARHGDTGIAPAILEVGALQRRRSGADEPRSVNDQQLGNPLNATVLQVFRRPRAVVGDLLGEEGIEFGHSRTLASRCRERTSSSGSTPAEHCHNSSHD
jgi:hypothetical protein